MVFLGGRVAGHKIFLAQHHQQPVDGGNGDIEGRAQLFGGYHAVAAEDHLFQNVQHAIDALRAFDGLLVGIHNHSCRLKVADTMRRWKKAAKKETRRPRPGRRVKTAATFEEPVRISRKPARAASTALRRAGVPAGEGLAVLQRHPRRHPCGNRRPIFQCAGCPPLFRAFPMPFLAITCLYCQYYRMIECFNAGCLRPAGKLAGIPFPKLTACAPVPFSSSFCFSRPHTGCRPRFPVPPRLHAAASTYYTEPLHFFSYIACAKCVFFSCLLLTAGVSENYNSILNFLI